MASSSNNPNTNHHIRPRGWIRSHPFPTSSSFNTALPSSSSSFRTSSPVLTDRTNQPTSVPTRRQTTLTSFFTTKHSSPPTNGNIRSTNDGNLLATTDDTCQSRASSSPSKQHRLGNMHRSIPISSSSSVPPKQVEEDELEEEQTPFMHESLSAFSPFPWQPRVASKMAAYQRKAGISEHEVQQREKDRMEKQLEKAYQRMGRVASPPPPVVLDHDEPETDPLVIATETETETEPEPDLEPSQVQVANPDRLPPRAMVTSPTSKRKVYVLETQCVSGTMKRKKPNVTTTTTQSQETRLETVIQWSDQDSQHTIPLDWSESQDQVEPSVEEEEETQPLPWSQDDQPYKRTRLISTSDNEERNSFPSPSPPPPPPLLHVDSNNPDRFQRLVNELYRHQVRNTPHPLPLTCFGFQSSSSHSNPNRSWSCDDRLGQDLEELGSDQEQEEEEDDDDVTQPYQSRDPDPDITLKPIHCLSFTTTPPHLPCSSSSPSDWFPSSDMEDATPHAIDFLRNL